MDVAVFVGFARSGPLDTPVAVEDVVEFVAIFGSDAPLAWEADSGEPVYALLGPSVRAFFANGGKRCWIIRVAGAPRANDFPVPGLVRLRSRAQGALRVIGPSFVRARSSGSWSDDVQVASAVNSLRVQALSVRADSLAADLLLPDPDQLVVGDLLRFTFRHTGE